MDPRSDPLDGTLSYWALANKEEDRDYVWAISYDGAAHGSVDFYEAMGYEVVTFTDRAGVRPQIGRIKPGEPVRRFGHTLMSRPTEIGKIVDQRTQTEYSKVERHVVDNTRRAVADHFRGQAGNARYDYVRPGKSITSDPYGEVAAGE